MKIGIYGGTFDPPHLGHFQAACGALSLLNLDSLVLIPARLPPHKDLPQDSAAPECRLEMLRLMADGMGAGDRVTVDAMELTRDGKSYTAETVKALHDRYPEDELILLMGTDMFLTFQMWHQPEEILKYASLCGFARTEADNGDLLDRQVQYLHDRYGTHARAIQLPQMTDISSTELRKKLRDNVPGTADDFWLPVYGYILKNHLYGTQKDLKHLSDDDLRAVSYSMVKAKRLRHIRGTEEEAVRLAKRWGVDETAARRGGILHDCTKYLDLTEQLQLCKKYDIMLDPLEQRAVKLLHSKTGAALAKNVFGEPPAVVDAIFYHTTGKADMTLLEKILYIADYMEPTRDFEGVERLRELAYKDLDAAVLLGCEMSVAEMEERGNPVHHNTLAARDFLKGTRQ
ncbi:MAG: bis(5'-nucleosyl)-tetraphosphatase (symmetrical) YqeK [Oscillospiraceae bacterium]